MSYPILAEMITNINDRIRAQTDREAKESSKGRSVVATARLGVFYLSLLLAGVMTVLFLPSLLALLALGWTPAGGAELGIHRLHVMGIAAVVAVFLLGLFVQAYRPRQRVASMWGAFLTILVVSAGTVGFGVGRPEEVLPFLLLTSVALIAHPAGRGLFRRGASYSPALLALVGLAAVPLIVFAVTQLSLSSSTIDPHAVEGHYVMMAGLLIAPLAYGIFAALGFAGWRLAAWLAALPMAYYGLMSIAFPLQAGSTGAIWGAAAILWAIAFVVVAEYSRSTTSLTLRREVQQTS
jgi:hypothetical protein